VSQNGVCCIDGGKWNVIDAEDGDADQVPAQPPQFERVSVTISSTLFGVAVGPVKLITAGEPLVPANTLLPDESVVPP
jgi:hypothetical protein